VGAGSKAVVPALAGIELADEIEESGDGGTEMRRELRDLVAETIHFGGGTSEGARVVGEHVHRSGLLLTRL